MPRGKVRAAPIDDVEAMRQEERARTKAEAAMSDSRAASAEERARERAEEAAKAATMAVHIQGGLGVSAEAAATAYLIRARGWPLAGGDPGITARRIAEICAEREAAAVAAAK